MLCYRHLLSGPILLGANIHCLLCCILGLPHSFLPDGMAVCVYCLISIQTNHSETIGTDKNGILFIKVIWVHSNFSSFVFYIPCLKDPVSARCVGRSFFADLVLSLNAVETYFFVLPSSYCSQTRTPETKGDNEKVKWIKSRECVHVCYIRLLYLYRKTIVRAGW